MHWRNLHLILLVCLIILALWTGCTGYRGHKSSEKNNIEALVRQIHRWHIASTQDNNPVIAMLHSNYAIGYIGALRSIATESEIYAVTKLDINLLETEATHQQDATLAKMAKVCPNALPKGSPAYNEYLQRFLSQPI